MMSLTTKKGVQNYNYNLTFKMSSERDIWRGERERLRKEKMREEEMEEKQERERKKMGGKDRKKSLKDLKKKRNLRESGLKREDSKN